jgi:hypothetical protein
MVQERYHTEIHRRTHERFEIERRMYLARIAELEAERAQWVASSGRGEGNRGEGSSRGPRRR